MGLPLLSLKRLNEKTPRLINRKANIDHLVGAGMISVILSHVLEDPQSALVDATGVLWTRVTTFHLSLDFSFLADRVNPQDCQTT